MNNSNPQGQWYQDCDVFTVVPGLCCVHSGTKTVVCSHIIVVMCSQTGALGREQREPTRPVVPGRPAGP